LEGHEVGVWERRTLGGRRRGPEHSQDGRAALERMETAGNGVINIGAATTSHRLADGRVRQAGR